MVRARPPPVPSLRLDLSFQACLALCQRAQKELARHLFGANDLMSGCGLTVPAGGRTALSPRSLGPDLHDESLPGGDADGAHAMVAACDHTPAMTAAQAAPPVQPRVALSPDERARLAAYFDPHARRGIPPTARDAVAASCASPRSAVRRRGGGSPLTRRCWDMRTGTFGPCGRRKARPESRPTAAPPDTRRRRGPVTGPARRHRFDTGER